ncbi:MAG: DUF3617 domain-containing protein [Casimicrobiaceae bacterium]|nr:DUF3617 domain-containing protein [Casimicrobiaceae bacterium]MDW8313297.1 DUF3617 family protein [Burkholderiales bacterium]
MMALVAALAASTPLAAQDQLPLDQLQQGLWKIERRIERLAGNDHAQAKAIQTRTQTYCVDPKHEIRRTLLAASFVCDTEITRRDDKHYEIVARCHLPGISGESRTRLTFASPTRYLAEVETKGRKWGDLQHRRERIEAARLGDCKPA